MDEETFKKLKSRNREVFEEVVKEYEQQLLLIAKSRLKDKSLAYDAVQETFTSLYINVKKIREYKNLKSWLVIVLINNCNSIMRKEKILEISYELSGLEEYLCTDNFEFKKIIDDINFFDIIDFLNMEERTIVAMYFSNDYTIKEISDILNINVGTLKSKMSRIKGKIRSRIEGDNYGRK